MQCGFFNDKLDTLGKHLSNVSLASDHKQGYKRWL